MKKLILFICIIFSMSAFAQDKAKQKEITAVTFYGIDFSNVKVYGASESPYDFKAAFYSINQLFVTEAKKYNVAKFFQKDVTTNIKAVSDLVSNIPTDGLMIHSDDYKISDAELKTMIKNFPAEEKEGVGLILVAELLDKAQARGHYHIVFFDLKTREIIDTWKADEKARGFGLRNFWARSAHQVMSKVRI